MLVVSVFLLVLIGLSCGLPLDSEDSALFDQLPENAVRVPPVAFEYMKQVFDTMTSNQDWSKRVWCFIIDPSQGSTWQSSCTSGNCITTVRHVFGHGMPLPPNRKQYMHIEKSMLRMYLQLVDEDLNDKDSLPVNITIVATLLSIVTSEVDSDTKVYQMTSSVDSSGWKELDVTQLLQQLWPQFTENNQIELTINVQFMCNEQSINPSVIIPQQNATDLQPFLLLYLHDGKAMQKIPRGAGVGPEIETYVEGHQLREERHATQLESSCKRESFDITFVDLGLSYILSPQYADIGKCNGDCNQYARNIRGTLFRRVAATMGSGESGLGSCGDACCSPNEYRPLEVLSRINGMLIIEVLPNAIVEGCGCAI